jgi:hypothetical protein
LTSLAKWLLLNSKAGAIVGLVLGVTTLIGAGTAGVQTIRLHHAEARLVPLAKDLGAAQGQLAQLSADSARRAAEAKAAVEAADARAQRAYANAKGLLNAAPAHPDDLCQSADELIRGEIQKEHQ